MQILEVVDQKGHRLRSNKSGSRHLHHAWLSLFPPLHYLFQWVDVIFNSLICLSLYIFTPNPFLLPPHLSILLCWSVSPSVHCLNSLFSHAPPSYQSSFSHLADHHYCGENSCQENPDGLPCGGPKIRADSLLKDRKGDVRDGKCGRVFNTEQITYFS